MPLYPFYFEAKDELKNVKVSLTKEQEEQRSRDSELLEAMDAYQAPFRERWARNGALYNLVQTGSKDPVANYYLGWGKILINHSVATMNEGAPEADFDPLGPSDGKLAVLWHALVKHALNKSNWPAHQRLWTIDNHAFGGACLKAYSELPMRWKRYEKADGSMVRKFVRDFRRAKTGLRHRPLHRVLRSHYVTDPDDVPVGAEKEILSWNGFVTRYANAILPDGRKKYDCSQIPAGSHVRLWHFYDEQEDAYRIYAVSYGGKPESTYEKEPSIRDLGKPIYDKPLSRYKFMDQGRTLMGGANVPGMTPLSFSIFEDQLDDGYETHALYGMGIPQIIEGPEELMHQLVNQTLTNLTLKNTVLVGYEPNSKESPSYLDIDTMAAYSGLMVDGKINAQPLGVADIGANKVMWDWLRMLMYQLTGINPEQITGDNLKTAFQSGLIVRQMNMRAKSRINTWANGPLKRSWTNLLANCLSEYTVEEWEEITEEDAKEMAKRVEQDELPGEDYDDEDTVENEDGTKTKVYKKRKLEYFPVYGRKFREDFTGKQKTRALRYDWGPNSASKEGNTLIEDPSMKGDVSYVPMDLKYLLPDGKIERIMEFDVKVDGKPMLGDLKIQDMEMAERAVKNVLAMAQIFPKTVEKVDGDKLLLTSVKPAGWDEKDVFRTDNASSKLLEAGRKAQEEIEQALSSPPTNGQVGQPLVQAPGMAPAPQAAAPAAGSQRQPSQSAGAPAVLNNFAGGAV